MASFVFRTSDLPKLDLDTDKGTDFQAWHQQWLAYRSLSGLDKEPATKQVQALQLCFSRETLNVVDNLGLTAAEKTDQAQIIAALKRHVDGRINETIERRNFRRRTQEVGECFDDFLVSLRELTKTCNFCNNDCLQKALRDQIIEGLLDGEIIQELLQVKDLTLDQAITMCRGLEAAKKSRHEVQGSPEVSTFRMQHGTGTSRDVVLLSTMVAARDALLTIKHAVNVERQDTSVEYVVKRIHPAAQITRQCLMQMP